MQGKRDKKAEELTGDYVAYEHRDLASYPLVPSPRGTIWKSYIQHRLKMLHDGMAAYATRRYARLDLDHYIESNREMDKITVEITNNQPSIIFLGGAPLAPNRPIGIKRRKRCPGTRKFLVSVKKLGHSIVIFVDEYNTSQTCANCFRRFPRNTKPHRFKVCRGCDADPNVNPLLANRIITQRGKRTMQMLRYDARRERVRSDRTNDDRLVRKVKAYYRQWPFIRMFPNELPTVVWHRDIVAAKCIMYKGAYEFHCKFIFLIVFIHYFDRTLQTFRLANTSVVEKTTTSAFTTNFQPTTDCLNHSNSFKETKKQ